MTNAEAKAPKFIVLDDHAAILAGTCSVLQEHYPDSKLTTANTAAEAKALVSSAPPDLLVMDLSVPADSGEESQTQSGLDLLKDLLADYPELNIVVQSAHVHKPR